MVQPPSAPTQPELFTDARGAADEHEAPGQRFRIKFSIAPTDPVPIVRERLHDEGVVGRQIELAAWDLRPAWLNGSKRPQFKEWLEPSPEKPMFKNAFTSRRALLPLSGYFEWTGEKRAPTTSRPAVHFSPRPAYTRCAASTRSGRSWVMIIRTEVVRQRTMLTATCSE